LTPLSLKSKYKNIGTVLEAGDGIAQVDGLRGIRSQELVEFSNGVMGVAFNLEKEQVGIIILGDYQTISEGMQVRGTGRHCFGARMGTG